MATLSAEALHDEGMRYLNGNGVSKDEKKAIEYFEQAIAIGNLPQSKYMLGAILLFPGSLSEYKRENADRGIELILEAAEEGYTKAMVYVVNTFGTLSYRLLAPLTSLLCFQFKTYSMVVRRRISLAKRCKKELSLK